MNRHLKKTAAAGLTLCTLAAVFHDHIAFLLTVLWLFL